MRRLLALLLLVSRCVNVCAEAVLTIKSKGRKITLRASKRGGAVIDKQGSTTVVTLRPKRDFETVKLTFKVLADDEFSFSLAGSYSRNKKLKNRQFFEWVDCNLFRVGDKELIGPKAEKEEDKKISVAKSQSVKGSVQAKRGDNLVIELSLRLTPREEARKLTDTAGLSEEAKERLKRREEREKERLAEREKQAKALKDLEDEAARERASGKRTFGYVPKKTDGKDQPAEEENTAKGKKKKKGKGAKSQTAEEKSKPAKGEAKGKGKVKGESKGGETSDEAGGNSGSGAEENGADGE